MSTVSLSEMITLIYELAVKVLILLIFKHTVLSLHEIFVVVSSVCAMLLLIDCKDYMEAKNRRKMKSQSSNLSNGDTEQSTALLSNGDTQVNLTSVSVFAFKVYDYNDDNFQKIYLFIRLKYS